MVAESSYEKLSPHCLPITKFLHGFLHHSVHWHGGARSRRRWLSPANQAAEFSLCLLLPQYHSKVSCFMLQHIEEPCSLGAHAAVVVPPTWILRVRRPQVSHLSSCGSFTTPACPAPPHGVFEFVSFVSRTH